MAPKPKNELRDDSIDATVSHSIRLLSQFDFAGVDPYALSYARVVAANYKASTSGERIFNHCLTNLPVFVAADDRLQLGWNESYLYRNLSLHQYEYEYHLLIAALSETLPEVYAAAVLSCLADKFHDENKIKPSIGSWTRLVRSMNGILTTSDFALMVDERMRLDPYRVASGHSTSCTNSLVPPTAFANALQALSDLSLTGTGDLKLVGGNFLGWFAAFTELFLGLNLHVTARDGHELYATHTESKATLHLMFLDSLDLEAYFQQESSDSTPMSLAVMCAPDSDKHAIPRIPFTGRVGWETLLPKVFESSFHRLAHQDSKCFVQSVGGVARLFQILVEDPNTPKDVVSEDNKLNPASWGKGLIQTLCDWFPEMRHLQARLERLQSLDRLAAGGKCDEGAQSLVKICGCSICSGTPFRGPDGKPTISKARGRLPESFCLLAIMETILNLGLAMSRTTVVPSVYPSRAGILNIYQRQVEKLLDAERQVAIEGNDRLKILFLNDWNAGYSTRLQTAAAIFSGSWPKGDLPDNLCAIRHEGICAYVMEIQYGDRSPRHRRDKNVIRVLPGHIAFKQRAFYRATTGRPKGIDASDFSWEEATLNHMSKKLYFK